MCGAGLQFTSLFLAWEEFTVASSVSIWYMNGGKEKELSALKLL